MALDISTLDLNIRSLIENESPQFELMVLSASAQSSSFFYENCGWICSRKPDIQTEYFHTFGQNLHNHIFFGIRSYWNSLSSDSEITAVPESVIVGLLAGAQAERKLLPREIERVHDTIQSMYAMDGTGCSVILSGTPMRYWHERKVTVELKSHLLASASQSNSELTIGGLYNQIGDLQDSLNMHDDNQLLSITEIMDEEDGITSDNTIPSGLDEIDRIIGGGFRRQEATLVAATTGGGKTVLATQIAANVAYDMRKNVVFISTEQRPSELIHRMVSSKLSIPIDHLSPPDREVEMVHGYPLAVWAQHGDRIQQFQDSMLPHLQMVNWGTGKKNVIDDLEVLFKIINRQCFKPDLLIFDWLGGGLKESANIDRRLQLENSAHHLARVCKSLDVAVLCLAQLNGKQSSGCKYPTNEMLHECKTTPHRMTNSIYISSLRTSEDEETLSYLNEQFVNVDKTRKGTTGKFSILRDFRYQRFLTPQMQARQPNSGGSFVNT